MKCRLCGNIMPHIPTRECKCHHKNCLRYSNALIKGHCTIFRKLSKEDLRQPDMSKEAIEKVSNNKVVLSKSITRDI